MYKAYSLRVDDDFFKGYLQSGETVKKANNSAAQSGLDAFFDGDGSLVATKIMEDWFPKMKADVFISHSHKDEALAIRLAGWLKDNLDVSSFIDSCVWGYSPELLKKLDKKFCLKESGHYDYDRRNITNGHVNMMLATSLTKMIDQCECIIFLNTPRSLSCKGCIESDGTESPWIYAEIEATRLLRKNIPKRRMMVKASMEERSISIDESISVKYDLDLKHLLLLDKINILKLYNCGKTGTNALDFLYDKI
ncbi:MAG: toll/interleukin-1 receptor domain-containing protein [Metakosakonia sp.]|nr:toll/interleukin-1 receptor domain-containing protein [Phytobacter sp.]MBV8875928.1 toll/interleukin-1 receptor domain-containing protein [Phytobacter sp.]